MKLPNHIIQVGQVKPAIQIPFITYCDTDPEQFRQACQIPLFPNQWNVWLINRTLRDKPTSEDIVSSTEALFGRFGVQKWFDGAGWWFCNKTTGCADGSLSMGDIDNLKVWDLTGDKLSPFLGRLDVEKLEKILSKEVTPFQEGATLKVEKTRSQDCSRPITVAGPESTKVLVAFVYRGTATSMAWPVFKWDPDIPSFLIPWGLFALGLIDAWCPVNADFAVEAIYSPLVKKPLPKSDDPEIEISVPKIALGVGGMAVAIGVGLGAVLLVKGQFAK